MAFGSQSGAAAPRDPSICAASATRTRREDRLAQARPPESFQIVLAVGLIGPWQLRRNPVQRDVGLGAAELAQRHLPKHAVSGHAGRTREHAEGAGEIASMAD